MVAITQLSLALEAEDDRSAKKWNGLDLDLIWIEIGVFKNFKECARSPCNGNHFSSIYGSICIPGTKHGMFKAYSPDPLFSRARERQYGGRVWVPETSRLLGV